METDYKEMARAARLKVLEMVYKAKSSHIGSNFSVIDILAVLFNKKTKDDQIILSAGWKAAAFYYFLAKDGLFPMEELETYNQEGSRLIGLTEPGVPGILFAGGSMQMGLPAAVGFALGKKIKGEKGIVYCVMSDGEMAGGMIYESLLIALQHKLDNLIILVDSNGLQAMGLTKDILNTDFVLGANEKRDGHDFDDIEKCMHQHEGHGPRLIILKTIKGKGVSFMENNNLYHYKDLSQEEYDRAVTQLLHS